MRPIRRRTSPIVGDYPNYKSAQSALVGRLGLFCSYCERRIVTVLAVEHIQPKDLPAYQHLIGRWDNFLLACVNCNSTKKDKNVVLAEIFLPDRDNTFLAFTYSQDGKVIPNPAYPLAKTMAENTIALVGLDKKLSICVDQNGKLIAIDRLAQRMEAWLIAEESKKEVLANPNVAALKRQVVKTALGYGFFSIWMEVFSSDANMRTQLIDAFSGTRESACFHATTSMAVSPGPNLDQLPFGGKI